MTLLLQLIFNGIVNAAHRTLSDFTLIGLKQVLLADELIKKRDDYTLIQVFANSSAS